jgi:hypothetical protein
MSNMDLYYKTPTKKIGVQDNMNYDAWVDSNHGIMQEINKSAEKAQQERNVTNKLA